ELPDMPLPIDTSNGFSDSLNSASLKSVPRPTVVFVEFGISIPTRDFTGKGA
ncbi:MAG: hypothetical protein K0S38_527, partial [Candidatus Paceibacter sp.]|nr:hypothetical protein [Candidatus Paceibacter sp.]